ncbi:MAG: hypothetical protein ACREAB_08590 [Blastocatellia bacterium]
MPKKSGSGNPAELIKMAIAGLDHQIKELTGKREQLAKMVPGVTVIAVRRRGRPLGATAAPGKPKRVVSEATKKKLRAAAKARWARERGEKGA